MADQSNFDVLFKARITVLTQLYMLGLKYMLWNIGRPYWRLRCRKIVRSFSVVPVLVLTAYVVSLAFHSNRMSHPQQSIN